MSESVCPHQQETASGVSRRFQEIQTGRRAAILMGLSAAGSLSLLTRPAAAAGGQVLRINAGGPSLTSGGVAWAADQYFSGGKSFTNTAVTSIANTTDDALYATERSATSSLGQFKYSIPAPTAGTYNVRLHFAEIWFGAPGGGPGGPGQRIFSVNIGGGSVELLDYDIWASVGAAAAVVKEYSVNVTGGTLTIDFTAKVDQPKLSAIEVFYPQGAPLPGPGISWPASWTAVKAAPLPCFETAAITVGGKIYRFGGFDSSFRVIRTYSSYDSVLDKWTSLGTMPATMAETHQGIASDGQYIYVAGGFAGDINASKSPSQVVNDKVWRYNPQTNTFVQIATLPKPRGAGALDCLNGKLHYISGNPADRVTNVGDHFVYDLATRMWSLAAPLPNPKDHISSAVLGGKIYIMGGEHGHDQYHVQQSDAHVYDPAANAWTALAKLPVAKSHLEASTFVSDGHIVMAGGQVDNFQPTAQVSAYNPVTNIWSILNPLPAPRQGAIVQRVGGAVVVALGGVQTSQPQSDVWIGKLT